MMRETSWMRTRRAAAIGFLPTAALCGGAWLLMALSGCAGESAPEAETPPTEAVEEVAPLEIHSPETTMSTASAAPAPNDSARGSVAGKIRDASLAAKVRLTLAGAPDLRAHWFEPEATNGHVILRGHVATWAQRERAAAVAASVSGVASVANELIAQEERPAALAEARGLSANGGENGLPRQTASPGSGAEGPAYHTVSRGESLWMISRRYGVRVDRIKAMNGLTSDAIRSGQRLRIR